MNISDLQKKLEAHLKSGYPGFFIQSSEGARVHNLLAATAANLGLSLKIWNPAYGWMDGETRQPLSYQGAGIDLASGLQILLDEDIDGKLISIEEARLGLDGQSVALARIKMLLERIVSSASGRCGLVLVSDSIHIPSEIEPMVTLLPLSLPSGNEVVEIAQSVIGAEKWNGLENSLATQIKAACGGMTELEIASVLKLVVNNFDSLNGDAIRMIHSEKGQIVAKGGMLELVGDGGGDSVEIGGLENLRKWLDARAVLCKDIEAIRAKKIVPPKGVMIAGMPGCGKSLTAKAAAKIFGLPLLKLDIGSLMGKYVGESEANMRKALTMAEAVSPCVLWIDELEKAFSGSGSSSGSEVSTRLFGYFLTWMQEKSGGVFVIATANDVSVLPPELLRKGRFDEVFYVGFPNKNERVEILNLYLKADGLKFDGNDLVVALTRDYSGSDIANAVNEARIAAYTDGRRALEYGDLVNAVKRTVPLRKTLEEQVGKYEAIFEKLHLSPASVSDGMGISEQLRLSRSTNFHERVRVAESSECSDSILKHLMNDSNFEVLSAVLRNPNCPESVLSSFLGIKKRDGMDDVTVNKLRQLAAVHDSAPQDLVASYFDSLKLDVEHQIKLAKFANNEVLQKKLLELNNQEVDKVVATSGTIGKEIQSVLVGRPSRDVALVLATNPALCDEFVEELASSRDCSIRSALAQRPVRTLSSVAQLKIAQGDRELIPMLFSRDDCSLDVFRLYLDGEENQRKLINAIRWAPREIWMSLAESCHESVRIELARCKGIIQDVLFVLARDKSEHVRSALAENISVDGGCLVELYKDEESDFVFNSLIGRFSNSRLFIDSLCEVNFAFSNKFEKVSRARLVIEQAVSAGGGSGVSSLATNGLIDGEVQDELISGYWDNCQILKSLASNPSISVRAQLRISDHHDLEILEAIAKNPSISDEVAFKLLSGKSLNARVVIGIALASNSKLSVVLCRRLLGDSLPGVAFVLLANPAFPSLLRLNLVNTVFLSPSSCFAWEGCEPVLVKDKSPSGNSIAGEAFSSLSSDPILAAAAAGISLASKMSRVFGSTFDDSSSRKVAYHASELALALASNPSLSDGEQNKLARVFGSKEFFVSLAGNPALIVDLQSILSKHRDSEVRCALASNVSLVQDVQSRLCDDTSSEVRASLAKNSSVSGPLLSRLATDKCDSVVCSLIERDHLDETVQMIVAGSGRSLVVRRFVSSCVSGGREVSPGVMEKLLKSGDVGVLVLIPALPNFNDDLARILSKNPDVDVRCSVARALSFRQDLLCRSVLLEELSRDVDQNVRFIAEKAMDGESLLATQRERLARVIGAVIAKMDAEKIEKLRWSTMFQ